jgi:membrane associated rhomboid family serine protease
LSSSIAPGEGLSQEPGSASPEPPLPPPDPLAEFHGRLAALTPRTRVAAVIVALNVVVYALMVAKGVPPMAPTVGDLVAWGGNFAPLSSGKQGWRLVTSLFVHVGAIHMALNSWVLWTSSRLVERMYGPAAFAVTYLLAGITASCTSAVWNPDRVSAGASGAVYGVFGALVVFLWRRRRDLDAALVKKLSVDAGKLLGYNLALSFVIPMVDMAAHVGGLLGGLVVAVFLVHAPTPEARAISTRRTRLVLAVGVLAAGGVWALLPRLTLLRAHGASVELVRRQFPGATIMLPDGAESEVTTTYQQGHLRLTFPEGGGLAFEWRTTEVPTEAEAERLVIEPLAKATNTIVAEHATISVGGRGGLRYILKRSTGEPNLAVTILPCGKRTFSFVVGAQGRVAQLEERIRESFTCDPDPAVDGILPSKVNVLVALGPDWGTVEEGGTGVAFASLDGEFYVVSPIPPHIKPKGDNTKAIMPHFLRSWVSAIQATEASFEESAVAGGPSPLWRGHGKRGGKAVLMFASILSCDESPYIVFYLDPGEHPDRDRLGLIGSARCAKAPARPLPFADLARDACARGDKRGCK